MKEMSVWIRYLVISGNIVFFLWILYNGYSEGFRGKPVEVVSGIGLLILLCFKAILLLIR
jgi:hypothetical protein